RTGRDWLRWLRASQLSCGYVCSGAGTGYGIVTFEPLPNCNRGRVACAEGRARGKAGPRRGGLDMVRAGLAAAIGTAVLVAVVGATVAAAATVPPYVGNPTGVSLGML